MRSYDRLCFFPILMLATVLATGCCKETPKVQKIADCTNRIVQLEMAVTHRPRYHFVLGIPNVATNHISFRGEVVISQSTGIVARIPISSTDMISCNWLKGLNGYILTWSRSNRADRLEAFLDRGQKYNVKVQFSETPPPASSLWFRSTGNTCPGL